MATTKICNRCNKTKPLSDFYTDKGRPDKKMANCRDCYVLNRKDPNRPRRLRGAETSTLVEAPKEVSIDFLVDFKRPSKIGWQLPQVKTLLFKVQEAYNSGVSNFDKIFAQWGAGRAKSSCVGILAEVKKLAVDNRQRKEKGQPEISLDEYWKTRKYKFGNAVIAEPKKNGKSKKK